MTTGKARRMDEDGPPQDVEAMLTHAEALRRFLARRLTDRHEIDDYVQEVYARAISAAPRAKIANWGGFLVRIASNLITDQRRRARVRQIERSVPIEDVTDYGDEGTLSPERAAIARQQLDTLRRELAMMSSYARQSFVLVRLEGHSPDEAARRLGLTPKAVRRHVERALVRLTRSVLEAL